MFREITKKTIDILIYISQPEELSLCEERLKNYSVISTNNLESAIKLLVEYEPKVALLESFSKSFDIEFLKGLQRIKSNTIVIKIVKEVEDYILYQKAFNFIYDYIKKPIKIEVLQDSVEKALRFLDYRVSNTDSLLSEFDGLKKKEYEFLLRKEEERLKEKQKTGRNIIETIVHSIYQGMGVGNLVSLVDFLQMFMIEDGEYTKVQTEILKSIISNAEPLQLMKERMDYMMELMDRNFEIQTIDSNELNHCIHKSIEEIESIRQIKNQEIILGPPVEGKQIKSNLHFLKISFKELLTNALKYSPEKSKIQFRQFLSPEGLSITILNSLQKITIGIQGVPSEAEFSVFEPFYKLNNMYDERYFREELGFGIGLTIIKNGLRSLGGRIKLYNVIDSSTSSELEKKV
ncbi:MAG: hypothetical protein KDK45_07500, partial [Leptospiraceae bacterium]|nr:hypothetical protein [Leptospiraceae bacterium]